MYEAGTIQVKSLHIYNTSHITGHVFTDLVTKSAYTWCRRGAAFHPWIYLYGPLTHGGGDAAAAAPCVNALKDSVCSIVGTNSHAEGDFKTIND